MKTFLLVLFAVIAAGCGRIETGHVGVRTDFNKTVEMEPLAPGWYGAVFTSVDEHVIKETELPLNDMTPKAKDNLSLKDLDVSIFYTVSPASPPKLFTKYSGMTLKRDGLFYPAQILLERTGRGVVYDSVAQLDSLTMHTRRNELELAIKANLQRELEASDKGDFVVTKVVVRQLLTDPSLEASIQQAVQVQKQIEAKENEIKLARAEAERKKVEAEGTARANSILAASLTDQFLRYEQIKAQREFARQGTHTVLLPPGGATPLVSVGK